MNTDTLEARLRKLEKQNRILTASLLLGVLLVACTSAMVVKQGPLASSEVRSNRFVLIDDKNNELGFWEISGGHPRFVFGSNSSARAVYLAEEKDNSVLKLQSPGSAYASITSRDDKGSLLLYGKSNAGDGYVNLGGGVRSGMTMQGYQKCSFYLEPSANEICYYMDAKGKTRFHWWPDNLNMNGQHLILGDINGKPIQTLPPP